jgi:hypothetical protein
MSESKKRPRNERDLVKIAERALKQAREEAIANGAVLVEVRGNQLVRFQGDRVLEVLEELPERRLVPKGTVLLDLRDR